jgi:hypothetical protein
MSNFIPKYPINTLLRDRKTGRTARVHYVRKNFGPHYILAGVRGKNEWFERELEQRFTIGFPYNRLWAELNGEI